MGRVNSADCPGAGCDVHQPHLLPSVGREVCEVEAGTVILVNLMCRIAGVILLNAKLKSTNMILA